MADPSEVAIAWLHDVIEDCDVTAEQLLKAGISHEVVEAVELLTRRDTVPPADYYAAIRKNALALAVKRADIADNTLDWRVAQLPAELRERLAAKYEKALQILGDSLVFPTDKVDRLVILLDAIRANAVAV